MSLISLQPKNLLGKDKQLPSGTSNLLSLGLKYCIALPKANLNLERKHIKCIQSSPDLYKNQVPTLASIDIEEGMTKFEKLLRTKEQLSIIAS
jgi:hypothetical protein